MAGFSDDLEEAILNVTLRNIPYTSPVTVYLSLHSADPGDTGANELAAANGYARNACAFDAPSGGVCANSADETFTASGADWSAATHFGIWDASTAGNCLYSGSLASPRTVTDGETATISAGDLTVTVT